VKKNCYKIENGRRNSGVTYPVRIASSEWVGSKKVKGAWACSLLEPRAATGSERFSYLHTTYWVSSLLETTTLKIRETTGLACEVLTSGLRPWLENVACLSSLLSWVTDVSRTWPEVILTGSQLDRKHRRIKRWRSPLVLEVSVTNNRPRGEASSALRRKKISLSVFIRVPRLWWRKKGKKGISRWVTPLGL